MKPASAHLPRTLSAVEHFTFGFGTMVGVGWVLAAAIAALNLKGIRVSGLFQDVATFGPLGIFAVFAAPGFLHGDPANRQPLFARPGAAGVAVGLPRPPDRSRLHDRLRVRRPGALFWRGRPTPSRA